MSSSDSEAAPSQSTDPFTPSWARALFAAAVAVATFWIPQEIPLEYYPLNNPSSGLQYLELTCAANVKGETQIYLDTGRGINDLDRIAFPIGPSEMAFTYTFPLADAPLFGIRFDPFTSGPGELRVTNFRIINRRGEEIRRFTPTHFQSLYLTEIVPAEDGWKFVTASGWDPSTWIRFEAPLIAEGMTERNLKRCLLSTSYLAMMLWIILLAVYFAFRPYRTWHGALRSIAFLLFLSVCFAFVGNRGLIRNSVRYAQVTPPWTFEIDIVATQSDTAQLFWDTGKGFSEADSYRAPYDAATGTQTLRFPLPEGRLQALRMDPLISAGRVAIRAIRVVDKKGHTRVTLPPDSLRAVNDIAQLNLESDGLKIETTPQAVDPVLSFTASSTVEINQTRDQAEEP